MSATIRVDIGRALADLMRVVDPGVSQEVGIKAASRWAGVYRAYRGQRNECYTFGLTLPKQVAVAWRLLLLVSRRQLPTLAYGGDKPVFQDWNTQTARNSAHTLAGKLTVALGLPGYVATGEERAFLVTIDANPGDLSGWTAYADWLQEREDGNSQWRGKVIAGWLGKKSMRYKYGMPDVKWGSDDYKIQTDYKHLPVRDLIGETLVPDLFADV